MYSNSISEQKNNNDSNSKQVPTTLNENLILFIGDPHFKVKNVPEVELFIYKIEDIAKEKNPDLIIIGGDLLDTHERLHSIPLNKAYEFIEKMRKIAPTYILVGNHDMYNNSQFLTENHWMNILKNWENVFIIDTTKVIHENSYDYILVPYVPEGRFIEALNTCSEEYDWKKADCIFAHQEFKGCKMGCIVSEKGDEWDISYPQVVSGHIHSKQKPQENIYYPGSAIQHAFGESKVNIVVFLRFKEKGKYEEEEVNLELPRKKILYLDVEQLKKFKIPANSNDQYKIVVTGNQQEFKLARKRQSFKKLTKNGNVKVVFKHDLIENKEKKVSKLINFREILLNLVEKENDIYLNKAMKSVIN